MIIVTALLCIAAVRSENSKSSKTDICVGSVVFPISFEFDQAVLVKYTIFGVVTGQ